MGLSKTDVFEAIAENRDTLRKYGVKRLALFGSLAKGESGEASDLDFVVEFEKKTFDAYMGLKFFLEDLFRSKVDLVLESALKPRIRQSILKDLTDVPGL